MLQSQNAGKQPSCLDTSWQGDACTAPTSVSSADLWETLI